MTPKEIKILMDYVKKRYDEVSMDYKTFDGDIDTDLSYLEQKNITQEYLDKVLPRVIPKLKRESSMGKQQEKQLQEQARQEEFKKIEIQAKLKFEEQLEKIANTPNSVLLDKLYYVPKTFIKMVLDRKSRGLLLYGEAGLGKTFNVKRALIDNNLKEGIDFNFVSGHITPMSFYKKLFYNKDRLLILDDINILESKINLNMLKASLSDNLVEYSSSVLKDVPNQFSFTGQIIILLNDKPKNSEHLKAVESRILSYFLEMDYETKIQILYDIAKANYEGITPQERQELVKWIKENTNQSTKNLSIRLLFMVFEFYKFDKDNWKVLASSYVQNDEYTNLMIQTLKETPSLKEAEMKFCEVTHLSQRSFWRHYSKLKGGTY
jgi:hypothetical protein